LLAPVFAAVWLAPAGAGAMAAPGARVGAAVRERLADASTARVVIWLEAPSAEGDDIAARRAEVSRAQQVVLDRLGAADFRLGRRYEAIPALAGEVTARGVDVLESLPIVGRVDLDAPVGGHLLQSVPLIGADLVQSVQGFTGQGILVAVIDTGIDTDHPDLADDLVEEACFCTTCCAGGTDVGFGSGAAEDDNGHGSNVTGIITSAGAISPTGVAPDAEILAIKVLNASGRGIMSDVAAALDWIVANRPAVDVVNMSLGSDALFAGDCDNDASFTLAMAGAINTLRARGTIVFASSGNSASGTTMGAPACIANTTSVGAVYDANLGGVAYANCADGITDADKVTCFSNSNDRTDVFAPGAAITSTSNTGGVSTFFGTSQASPHGAGCAALLREMNPGWDAAAVEEALESTGVPVVDGKNLLTFPRIDCLAATGALPDLVHDSSSVVDTEKGNGNGVADPGDRLTLIVSLRNDGLLRATGITGTLSTTTPGVTVLGPSATWSDIPRNASRQTAPPHFTVQLAPEVPCGSSIQLDLDVASAQAPFDLSFSLPVGVGSPPTCAPVPCVVTATAASSPSPICEGESSLVSAAGSSENGSDCSGGIEYRFELDGLVLQDWSADLDLPVAPAQTTFYQVLVRDRGTQALGQAFPSVQVNPAPATVVVQTPDPMCVELGAASLDAGAGFATYAWRDGSQVLGTAQVLPVTGADCGRTLTVDLTTAQGCARSFDRAVACVACRPAEVSPAGAAVPLRMGLDAAGTIELGLLPDPDVTYHLYHASSLAAMLAGDWTHKLCDLDSGPTGTWNAIDATRARWTPIVPGLIFEGFWVVIAERLGLEGPYGVMTGGAPRPPDADAAGSAGSFGCP
jgi:subtilisin family serine protease